MKKISNRLKEQLNRNKRNPISPARSQTFEKWLCSVQQIPLLLLAVYTHCFNGIHEEALYNNGLARDDFLDLFMREA